LVGGGLGMGAGIVGGDGRCGCAACGDCGDGERHVTAGQGRFLELLASNWASTMDESGREINVADQHLISRDFESNNVGE